MRCTFHTSAASTLLIMSMIVFSYINSFADNLQEPTESVSPKLWRVHDMNRPQPPRVKPATPGKAPSDAIVLFDGKDLSMWTDAEGNPAPWKVVDNAIEVVPKREIFIRRKFLEIANFTLNG